MVTSRAGGAHGTHAARIHFTLAQPVVDEQAELPFVPLRCGVAGAEDGLVFSSFWSRTRAA